MQLLVKHTPQLKILLFLSCLLAGGASGNEPFVLHFAVESYSSNGNSPLLIATEINSQRVRGILNVGTPISLKWTVPPTAGGVGLSQGLVSLEEKPRPKIEHLILDYIRLRAAGRSCGNCLLFLEESMQEEPQKLLPKAAASPLTMHGFPMQLVKACRKSAFTVYPSFKREDVYEVEDGDLLHTFGVGENGRLEVMSFDRRFFTDTAFRQIISARIAEIMGWDNFAKDEDYFRFCSMNARDRFLEINKEKIGLEVNFPFQMKAVEIHR